MTGAASSERRDAPQWSLPVRRRFRAAWCGAVRRGHASFAPVVVAGSRRLLTAHGPADILIRPPCLNYQHREQGKRGYRGPPGSLPAYIAETPEGAAIRLMVYAAANQHNWLINEIKLA